MSSLQLDSLFLLQPTIDMESSTEERNSENQPLLVSEKQPLSRVQLALLCFLRLLDPLSFTQIFPYINEFMKDLNVTTDPSKIGFYSGLVVSVLLLTESAIHLNVTLGELICRLPTHVDISMGFYVWYRHPSFPKNNLTQHVRYDRPTTRHPCRDRWIGPVHDFIWAVTKLPERACGSCTWYDEGCSEYPYLTQFY